jgi:Virus neck protein
MAVSTFFDNYTNYGEQQLLVDLGTEMIQRYGIDVYYMPRSHVNIDRLWNEDTLSEFTQATLIEVYIKTFSGWGGEGDLMQKFGISMADQITFSMMRNRWSEEFTQFQSDLIRPLEGDFIYLPLTHALFEVKFVEHESNFYQTGLLTYYDIKCERVNFSSEKIQTGVAEIDNIANKFSNAADDFFLTDEDGNSLLAGDGSSLVEGQFDTDKIDPSTQNTLFSEQGRTFIDFSKKNPFGEII